MSKNELWFEQIKNGLSSIIFSRPLTFKTIPEKNKNSFPNNLLSLKAEGNRSFFDKEYRKNGNIMISIDTKHIKR